MGNKIIFFDFETGGLGEMRNGVFLPPQPVQLACVSIDFDSLSFTRNDIWSSYMRPIIDPDEAIAFGVEPLKDKALEINHTNREMLAEAPETRVVWEKFCGFVKSNSKGSSPFSRAIAGGFNILNFDLPIIDNLAGGIYKFGPADEKGKNKLFHPRDVCDIQKILLPLIGHFPNQTSFSMDTIRTTFGFPPVNSTHNALTDVIEGAALTCRIFAFLRKISTPSKFNGSFANFNIQEYL